jgi:CheY-like chemotaxis protein
MEASQGIIRAALSDQKCILVVEDDPLFLQMLQGIIEELGGYQVMLAANGFQALALVRSRKPDLLLLDYYLPGMNGLDLYHRLHTQSAYADIPAFFLSTDALQSLFKREQLAFMSKPFDIEDFLRQIETLLSG